jgi:hypothetical protein
MVYLFVSISFLVSRVPVPERQPLSVSDAEACAMVLTSAVSDFGRNLRNIELDSIVDMKLFADVQRTKVRGLEVLLRGAELELSRVEDQKARDALLDGCREQRLILQRAAAALKGIEAKPNVVVLYREVGRAVLESTPFIKFLKLKMESKPTVGEFVIPAP